MKKGTLIFLLILITSCASSGRTKLHMNEYQSYSANDPTLKSIAVALTKEYLKTAKPEPCDEISDIYVRGLANRLMISRVRTITEQWIAVGCDNSYDLKVTFIENSYEVSVTQY